jgi:hypothetical protein
MALSRRGVATTLIGSLFLVSLTPLSASAALPRAVVADSLPLPTGVHVVTQSLRTTFDVTLAGRDPSGLSAFLTSLYQPSSPNFHHFITPSQFAHRFGASAATVNHVSQYLRHFGLVVSAPDTGHILVHVTGTTSQISSAFATQVDTVRRANGTLTAHFRAAASLPVAVAPDVTAVVGLSSVVQPSANISSRSVNHVTTPTSCPSAGTVSNSPNSFGGYPVAAQAQLYGLNTAWAKGINGAGQTIAVYELGLVDTADTNVFFSCYHLSPSITTVNVDGGATGALNDEATMDVEEVAALAPGAALQVYSGPNTSSGPVDIYSRIANDNTASIVTTSWGDCELDPAGATTAENQIFQQMAAQGQTVIAAAGDAGSSDCVGITSKNPVPTVDDPASQPLVTGVGALTVNTISPLNEKVWNSGPNSTSGGGQSVVWSRPSWQVAPGITSAYTGRLVPDLSVMGDPASGFIQYFTGNSTGTVTCTSNCSGGWGSIGGTSIGAPLVSALVATAAQACSTSRLGLINPTLYSIYSSGTAYSDVTVGSNDAYAGRSGDPGVYSAGPGFDLASGLGSPTPNFLFQLCPTAPSQTRAQSYVAPTSTVGKNAVLSLSLHSTAGMALANSQVVVSAVSSAGGTPGIDGPATTKSTATATVNVSTDPQGYARIDISSLVPGKVAITVSYNGAAIVSTEVTFKEQPLSSQLPTRVHVSSLRSVPGGLTVVVAVPTPGSPPVSRFQVSVNNGRSWTSFSTASHQVTLRALHPGSSYSVVVRAVNGNGNSPWTRVGPVVAGR